MSKLLSPLLNKRGSVLLMAMGAGALVLIVGAGMVNWYTHSLKTGQKIRMDSSVKIIQHRLVSAVDNDVAWTLTVMANANLLCFRSGGQDCTGATGPLVIYGINGGPEVIGLKNSNIGFMMNGERCTTFNPAPGAGDDECPFQLDVTFRSVCAPSCMSVKQNLPFAQTPAVEITANVVFNPRNFDRFNSFNPARHTLVFIRGHKQNEDNYMAALCTTFNAGVTTEWNATTKRCRVRILEVGICPPNFHLAGVDPATGGAECRRSDMTNVHCERPASNPNRGNSIVGFTEWSEPICGKFDK